MSQPVDSTPSIPVQRLLDSLEGVDTSRPHTVHTVPLAGGHVAAGVYRVYIAFEGAETISFVQKRTRTGEVVVMQSLAEHFNLAEIPKLIDAFPDTSSPGHNGSSWFIMPYYDGTTLAFDDDLPPSVIRALASVHAFYAAHPDALDSLPRLDSAYIDSLLDYITLHLDEHREKLTEPVYDAVQGQLTILRDTSILARTLERLPMTLTHGDVHPGNVIQLKSGQHILFDWGNARIAPAMLDLANMVNMDTDEWNLYLSAWNDAAGRPLDLESARLGYTWATAMVNLQYLPFAIGYLDASAVTAMTEKIQNALSTLQSSL
jgi:thiamine kinase-like enzyme